MWAVWDSLGYWPAVHPEQTTSGSSVEDIVYIYIYTSWYMFGCRRMGEVLRPRHFLDEFTPMSGFQKGLLTRKTSHRQPHSFLLVQREELLYDFGGMRQDLVHCSGPILEIYKACLSHCQKLKSVPILVSWRRLREMLGSWMDSHLIISSCAHSKFLHPGSGRFCPLNSQKHVTVPAPGSKFDASRSQKDERATE